MTYPGEDGEEQDGPEAPETENPETENPETENPEAENPEAEAVAAESEEQLALGDEEEALPWLEAEDDYYDEGGFDARPLIIGLLGLLVVAAILLLLWWSLKADPDPELAPDGSTIEAPEGPVRERPDDPGGSEVAGTGDTSFGVSEGQGSEGQIASPGINLDQAGETTSSEGVGVQIGAFGSRETARTGWQRLRGQFSDLQGLSYRIIEAEIDSGTIYRLQAVAQDRAAARELCNAMKAAGGDCQVKS